MRIANGIILEEELWYWEGERGELCALNMSENKVYIKHIDTTFPGYRIFYYGDNIYVTCQREEKILVFNKSEKKVKIAYMQEKKAETKVYFPLQWKQYLYLMPSLLRSQEVVIFNMRTGEFTTSKDILNKLENTDIQILPEAQCFFPSICDDVLWGAIAYTKYYYSYHLETGELHVKSSELCDALWAITCKNKNIYMLQERNVNFLIAKEGKKEEVITIDSNRVDVIEPYSCIIALEHYLVILSRSENYVVIWNPETSEKREINLYAGDEIQYVDSRPGGSKTISCVENREYIYILPWLANVIYAVHKQTWEAEIVDITYDEVSRSVNLGRNFFERSNKPKEVFENAGMTVENLCLYLANEKIL